MTDQIRLQLCKEDFYLMMRNAVLSAGGTDRVDEWKKMKLEELVDLFARNGIRMTYMPEKHMNAVKVVWGQHEESHTGTPRTKVHVEMPPTTPPKKKQLLCDSLDKGEEDESWNPAG